MKSRKLVMFLATVVAFVVAFGAPANAASVKKYEATIKGLYNTSITGKATLTQVTSTKSSTSVSVKGLPAGNYVYAITVQDVVAPGGGGHFTNVDVCTLNVVNSSTTATCSNGNVTLPAGVPIAGASAYVRNTVTSLAQGNFVVKKCNHR